MITTIVSMGMITRVHEKNRIISYQLASQRRLRPSRWRQPGHAEQVERRGGRLRLHRNLPASHKPGPGQAADRLAPADRFLRPFADALTERMGLRPAAPPASEVTKVPRRLARHQAEDRRHQPSRKERSAAPLLIHQRVDAPFVVSLLPTGDGPRAAIQHRHDHRPTLPVRQEQNDLRPQPYRRVRMPPVDCQEFIAFLPPRGGTAIHRCISGIIGSFQNLRYLGDKPLSLSRGPI